MDYIGHKGLPFDHKDCTVLEEVGTAAVAVVGVFAQVAAYHLAEVHPFVAGVVVAVAALDLERAAVAALDLEWAAVVALGLE